MVGSAPAAAVAKLGFTPGQVILEIGYDEVDVEEDLDVANSHL